MSQITRYMGNPVVSGTKETQEDMDRITEIYT